ncbi:MAG: PAS domain S-box protein, partial [Chloroflexi bacterium]|nr:PAS domain S-box protein [Chloroflexota bacterium]
RESEVRLQLAMDAGEHGFWDYNVDTGDVFFSPRYNTMLGYEPGEIPMRFEAWVEMVHPEDRKTVVPEVLHFVEIAKPFLVEFRMKCKDGSWKWISGRGKSFEIDENGVSHRAVGVHVDITEQKRKEDVQSAQLRLIDYAAGHTVTELLQKFLDEAEILTDSEVGFYHFVEEDQKAIRLKTWSKNTLGHMCTVEKVAPLYLINEAGVWADSVRERTPVIHNDYASLLHRKGLPKGHVPLIRELTVPVMRGNKVMAILGVGNKRTDYDQQDVKTVQQLADQAWETVVRKQAEEALRESEERLRTVIESVHTGIIIIDPDSHTVVDVNDVTAELVGIPKEQIIGNHCCKYFCKSEKDCCPITDSAQTLNNSERIINRADGKQATILKSVSTIILGGKEHLLETFIDITARKQTEAELQRSADVVNNIQVGLYIYHLEKPEEDDVLRILGANQATVELLGIPTEDVVGRTIDECFPAIKENGLAKIYADVARNGVGVNLEDVFYGDERIADSYFSIKAFPLPGSCVGVAFEDITERKKMDEAINTIMKNTLTGTGQKFFDQLVKSICDWSGTDCTLVGEFIEDNKVRVLSMYLDGKFKYGYTYDLEGTPCENAVEHGFCAIIDDVQKRFPKDSDLVEMGAVSYVGIPLSGNQGILCSISRKQLESIPRMKEILSILAARASEEIMRNKSDNALRASEERFRNLVETSQDLIFRTDTEGRFTYLNSAWEEALGYKVEEMQGKKFREFMDPEIADKDEKEFARILECGSTLHYESTYLSKSGEEVHFRFNARLVLDNGGQLLGTHGTAYNITESKLLDEERTKAAKLESIGVLAGGIAHDFNN